jgi:putative ABC transport system permease protein
VREVVPALQRVYPSLPVNLQHFLYWRDHSKTFEAMAALRGTRSTLTGAGEPVEIDGIETTADLFRVLGTTMAQGRGFLAGEDRLGKGNVVVITDSMWRNRLRGAPDVLGRSIVLNGEHVTVVGILPANFRFPAGDDLGQLAGLGKRTEIFRPLQDTRHGGWDGDYDFICIARRAKVPAQKAIAELEVLTKQLSAANHVDSRPTPLCQSLQDQIAGPVSTSLAVLLAAVMALLLIVCVNLANLTLARASVRAREFSIRTALGAGARRLVQQILTEVMVISALGGGLGVGFAAIGIKLFAASGGASIPRIDEIGVDGTVLLFSTLITVFCAAIFGLIPAFRIIRADPQEALRAGTHTVTTSRQSLRLRETLVGVEVALSTVLLFLAGLLITSLMQLVNIDKGFREERAATVDLSLPGVKYRDQATKRAFFQRTLRNIRAIPGVRSAAFINALPLTGESHVNGIELEGSNGDWTDASSRKSTILINVRFISEDYFETLGIPVVQGRAIEAQDENRAVSVVSARLAAKVWPGQNPIGKTFKTGSRVGKVEVIGVVRDTYNGRLDKEPTLIAYVPYALRDLDYGSLAVRTAMEPTQLMQAIRRTIWSIDSELPVPPMRTVSDLVDDALARRRFQMRLASAFGAGALLLALIGIYGVVAYNVAQRRTELGLRLALGAKSSELLTLILKRGLKPVFIGLSVGLVLCVACGSLIRGLLFGVTATDPVTVAAVTLTLSTTAFLACLMPSLGALRTDPATVLRYE